MASPMSSVYNDYLKTKMHPVLESMVTGILTDRPNDIYDYMIDFLRKWDAKNGGLQAEGAEETGMLRGELEFLRKEQASLQKRISCFGGINASEPPVSGGPKPVEAFLAQVQEEQPPRADSAMSNRSDGAVDTKEEEAKEREKMGKMKDKDRRAGVSAQAISADRMKNWKRPSHAKSQAATEKLHDIIGKNDKLQVLFGHLTDAAVYEVIDSMFPRDVASGESIIKQGEEGDNFYIIDEGSFDVLVQRGDADPVKVLEVGPGAAFGELALMYNAPRAATVTATSASKVWGLDQETFQMMLTTAENTKKKQYEGFLEEVEILRDLTKYEMAQLSDMLESELFDAGEAIINQGEEGNYFYILEDGEAKAYIGGEKGEIEVKTYNKPGAYFGEIALLTSATRRATVRASGEGCTVLSVARDNFDRVLGPIKDILAKNIDQYPQYADFLKEENEKAEEEAREAEKIKNMKNKSKREGVSANSISEEKMKNWTKPTYDKPAEATEKLKKIIADSEKLQVLFGHLTDTAVADVIAAMFPKDAEAADDVIKQGEEGDNFYIVDEGTFDVYVQRGDSAPAKVLEVGPGAAFGELALMYNAPRAATVRATSKAKLWCLDRETFQMMLTTAENTKKREYEGFLEKVEILKDLTKYEMAQLSDMLESELFDAGEAIITQGDEGNYFYIIEDGEAKAFISGEQGEIEVKHYNSPGTYFGEIALLEENSMRRATVRAAGGGCSVLSVNRNDFDRVLGPVKEILMKNVDNYPQYANFLKIEEALEAGKEK